MTDRMTGPSLSGSEMTDTIAPPSEVRRDAQYASMRLRPYRLTLRRIGGAESPGHLWREEQIFTEELLAKTVVPIGHLMYNWARSRIKYLLETESAIMQVYQVERRNFDLHRWDRQTFLLDPPLPGGNEETTAVTVDAAGHSPTAVAWP